MTTFNQEGQNVNVQTNITGDATIVGGIHASSTNNRLKFIQTLKRFEQDLVQTANAKVIDAEILTEAQQQINSAIQQAETENPAQKPIVDRLEKAKDLLSQVSQAAGLVAALVKLIAVAASLF